MNIAKANEVGANVELLTADILISELQATHDVRETFTCLQISRIATANGWNQMLSFLCRL
jgi:hypothetical protein